MPRERRKWTEAEDAILRDAVLKGGEGACDWHLIASCIPGRTNKDCRKRWHYKVAATVNKGPWEVAEDERLWAAVQEHGSRWALVAQVVKTRNGDQCSKRWYDALDPSIDHSPWTPEEDVRLLEAIDKHGRNWKAIVKAYFPRRTSLSAKNRYSLLIRKMEPKKQSQSSAAKKASNKPLPKPLPQQEPLARSGALDPRFHPETSLQTEENRQFHANISASQSSSGTLSVLFEPGCQQYNSGNPNGDERLTFGSPLISQKPTPDEASYTPASSECPPLSPTDWSGLASANTATSEASFPIATPPSSNEDMSLFFNDLQLNSRLSQGDLVSFANAKHTERIISRSLSLDQRNMSSITEVDFRRGVMTPRSSSGRASMNSSTMGDGSNTNSRIVTVLINSEIPETVNSIVNQIGREAGVSIAIHLE